MPSGRRLDLNEALEDSPQTQATLSGMEGSVGPLRDFVLQMKDTCQTLHSQQLKVAETVNHFGKLLSSVDDKIFGDKDPFAIGALKQLGKYVTELHNWQEMLCIQIDHAIVQQLESFLTNDMSRLNSLKEAFHFSKTDHEQSIAKYNRVSKKKETERSRFDANSDLFTARRRFHQSSLQYYAELNSFQFKKKFQLLDPMLAFMHSQLAFFKMGHEILTDEVGKFLTMLNVEIQKVRSEYDQSMKQQKSLATNLEQQSAQICIPDPDPSDPFVEYQPANLQLQSKSGYLLYRLQGSKWERVYFYTKEHLLYWQHTNRAAEVLIDLTSEGVDASSTDIDDRRYVFQIITVASSQQPQQPSVRKALYFQAESAKSRDEWIATIVNIVARKREHQQPFMGNLLEFETRQRTDSDLVRMERERVRTFVQSYSTSKLPNTANTLPILPQQSQTFAPPPLPPRRPPPPRHQSRPPAPPPPFGGGTSKQDSVQKILEMADNDSFESGNGYMNSFVIRYLGSLEVEKNKGVSIVKDAIRRIVAARALKNIMAVYYVKLVVTHKGISLIDTKSGSVTENFKMKDVSYCACHPDNAKLFGFIARVWDNGKYKHVCHVFESEKSSKEVYQAVIDAIKAAVHIITSTSRSSIPPSSSPPPPQDFSHQQQDAAMMSLPHSPNVMPPPNTGGHFDTLPVQSSGHRGMPKSLSTGSFRVGQLGNATRLSIPDDHIVEKDSGIVDQQDLLVDISVDPTYEVMESYTIKKEPHQANNEQLAEEQPLAGSNTPVAVQPLTNSDTIEQPISNDGTTHIYATIKKPDTPPLPPPFKDSTTPFYDTIANNDSNNDTTNQSLLVDVAQPSVDTTTSVDTTLQQPVDVPTQPVMAPPFSSTHQFDADFDSLLELQQATDIATRQSPTPQ